jgi:hypothetical protein
MFAPGFFVCSGGNEVNGIDVVVHTLQYKAMLKV